MTSNGKATGSQTPKVAGQQIDVDAASVRSTAGSHYPEAIQTHWVEVEGILFPPKQLLQLCTGIPRSDFISHQALRVFQRLGFATSQIPQSASPTRAGHLTRVVANTGTLLPQRDAVHDAVGILFEFMRQASLTDRIAQLEHELLGATQSDVAQLAGAQAISDDMLAAALTIRSVFGRVNDVIHASVIALSLQQVLEPGEQITNRPSLAAGNDPSRPFDLETNKRIAEFKVSVWTGRDAMRKRGVFADMIHLALDETDRRQQLFVVGEAPKRFLETTISTGAWGLSRSSQPLRHRYQQRFGSLEVSIAKIRATHASSVEIVDLTGVIPGIDRMLAGEWNTDI